ncbi:MAG: four helix bundle protein [Planctomycetes bacterium]|nr:four helix bundle protein [Planctomycetota bacterium]
MIIRHFSDIKAWQAARSLVREIYALSSGNALERDFGLRDQLRRSAVSVMSNIAEGFGRGSDRDFVRFLDIAQGSANEVQSLLFTIFDLGYADMDQIRSAQQATERALALIRAFRSYLTTSMTREPTSEYDHVLFDGGPSTEDGEPASEKSSDD